MNSCVNCLKIGVCGFSQCVLIDPLAMENYLFVVWTSKIIILIALRHMIYFNMLVGR